MIIALAVALAVQQPVRVEINHDEFSSGDRARVYVQSAQDGYLVVLHADADGRVRVLFPVDPSDDAFVRGGRKFEVRGRNDRDAFQIADNEGSGTVLAAVSPDQFDFTPFVRNDHWDFRALGGPSSNVKDDPLANLVDIVQRMAGDSSARFEYDEATYVVRPYRYAGYGYDYGYPYPRFGVRIGFGYPFYDPFCDPFWGCYGGFGYPYSYGFFYRPIYRYRPIMFANFGTRFVSRPRFVFPNRQPVTAVPVRPRTVVPVDTRSRDLEPRRSPPTRGSGDPRIAPDRGRTGGGRDGRGSWGSGPKSSGGGGSRPSFSGGRSSGGGRTSGGRPSNAGGGRRH